MVPKCIGTSYTRGSGNRTLMVEGVEAVEGGGAVVVVVAFEVGGVGVVGVVVDMAVVVDVVVVFVVVVITISSAANSDNGIRFESNNINSVLCCFVGTDDTNTTRGHRFDPPPTPLYPSSTKLPILLILPPFPVVSLFPTPSLLPIL